MNGRANLDRLRRALCRGDRIPEDERRWLIAGLKRWDGSSESLEVSLGICRDRDSLRARDGCLKAAAAAMPDEWSISEQVRQIERTVRSLSTFDDESEVDWENRPAWCPYVWMAMQEAPLPGSWRLRDFCKIPQSPKKTASS